jgi:hypothetical protein
MPTRPPNHRLGRVSPIKPKPIERRGSARERGYTTRWDKARLSYLRDNPLCLGHQARGRIQPATVVDHVIPHQGDQSLFWDKANWQPCCRTCHDSVKARLEAMWAKGTIGSAALRLDSEAAIRQGRMAYREIAETQ